MQPLFQYTLHVTYVNRGINFTAQSEKVSVQNCRYQALTSKISRSKGFLAKTASESYGSMESRVSNSQQTNASKRITFSHVASPFHHKSSSRETPPTLVLPLLADAWGYQVNEIIAESFPSDVADTLISVHDAAAICQLLKFQLWRIVTYCHCAWTNSLMLNSKFQCENFSERWQTSNPSFAKTLSKSLESNLPNRLRGWYLAHRGACVLHLLPDFPSLRYRSPFHVVAPETSHPTGQVWISLYV